MPKQKTKKSVLKRVKVTSRGKLLRHRAGSGHLKSRKNQKRIRRLRKVTKVPEGFELHAERLLGLK